MKKATGRIVDPEYGDMPTSKLGLIDLIRIPTEIDIVLRSTTARKHELEGLVKSMKKPEQEMLDAEVSKLGMGLNMFGKSEVDVLQQSKSALSNAAGVLNAGNDIAQTIPNVRALLPEDEEDNDNDEEEEPEGSEQGSERENATGKNQKEKRVKQMKARRKTSGGRGRLVVWRKSESLRHLWRPREKLLRKKGIS